MAAKVLRASPLSVVIGLVVAAVAVTGYAVTRSNIDNQNLKLLQRETAAAAALGSQILTSTGDELSTLATAVSLTGGSASAFDAQAGPASASAGGLLSFVLARAVGSSHYQVVASAGSAFTQGQVLNGVLGAVLSRADADSKNRLVPLPVVHKGQTSTAGFAQRPPQIPAGSVLYEQFTIPTFTVARDFLQGGPFDQLTFALYGSATASPRSILVATSPLPSSGPSARSAVSVGVSDWLLVAQSRTPLAGSLANNAPVIILVLGLVLALILAGTVEVLVRRQRYASHLVSERTAQLERSLEDLRDAQQRLVRGERLAALGEMASVVGHELRNPLTAVMNAIFLLRRGLDETTRESVARHLDMAERETAKAAALAEDLTAFVRPRKLVLSEVDLAQVVREVIQATPPPDAVDVEVQARPVTVVGDRGQLAEVLTNLVTNAYQALPDGGLVKVSAGKNGTRAIIVVEDDGAGIEPELADKIFEPFFTTKSAGTGLGLAIVRRLVEAHGGDISISNASVRGARVTVRIPFEGPDRSPAEPETSAV